MRHRLRREGWQSAHWQHVVEHNQQESARTRGSEHHTDCLRVSVNVPVATEQSTIITLFHLHGSIASGLQTEEHPHPGRAFFAVGFPRICYLPDCPLGRKVLRFLKIAFDRRLLFSIGRSVTTGREDVVIWNSVDHKTQFNMFPDPTYLQRTMQQLVHLGVTD